MKIQLNFINRSSDSNNSNVVIFQKPTNPSWNIDTVAWQVIKNCGRNANHPFEYDFNLQISAADSFGNYTEQQLANPGDALVMIRDKSGDVLQYDSCGSSSPTEIQVKNHLTTGSIDACCYRSGSLVAKKSNVVPDEEAIFEFKPFIYVGVLSNIEVGQVMNSAIVSEIIQEFSLLGLRSADLVMRGGGFGNTSVPYTFALENKVYM